MPQDDRRDAPDAKPAGAQPPLPGVAPGASLDGRGPRSSVHHGLYTLYGAQISNYTAKVRSCLIFKGLPFQEVVASDAVYDTILVPQVGFRMMPVVATPAGALLQDSTDIIDWLEQRHPEPSVYPAMPVQRLVALLLEAYAHDWLRIPAMYFLWAFPEQNHDYIVREFGRMYAPMAHPDDQARIGDERCAWTRDRLPSLGVTDRTRAAMHAWGCRFLEQFDRHLAEHPFLLGSRPCVADFALMGPLYGHLYRDPYSSDLMRRLAPRVVAWVERMHSGEGRTRTFASDDSVPETLYPMLRHAFAEYLPVAFDTVRRVEEWIGANPAAPIPRFLGTQSFRIEDIEEQRAVWTCIQYMIQRPLAHYQAAPPAARSHMDALLAQVGGRDTLGFRVTRPVRRIDYRLVAA